MNKKMTPLEALEKIKQARYSVDFELDAKVSEDYKKELDIIETALKDYEKIKEEKLLLSAVRDLPNLYKKLKALEIIKEKGCLHFCLLGISLEDYNISVDNVNKSDVLEYYKHYTQEEFDLLKEVLK